jgi:hypothetical protein
MGQTGSFRQGGKFMRRVTYHPRLEQLEDRTVPTGLSLKGSIPPVVPGLSGSGSVNVSNLLSQG